MEMQISRSDHGLNGLVAPAVEKRGQKLAEAFAQVRSITKESPTRPEARFSRALLVEALTEYIDDFSNMREKLLKTEDSADNFPVIDEEDSILMLEASEELSQIVEAQGTLPQPIEVIPDNVRQLFPNP